MRTTEVVASEVEHHVSVQAIRSFGEGQRFSGQPFVLLEDGQVASFDERG